MTSRRLEKCVSHHDACQQTRSTFVVAHQRQIPALRQTISACAGSGDPNAQAGTAGAFGCAPSP
jgi:hypothetical protein